MTAPPLYLLLREARHALAAETPSALHELYGEDSAIGLPFTNAFQHALEPRYHYSDTIERYSLSGEIVEWCHSEHPEHRTPDGGKPLCAQMVYLAVWHRDPFGDPLTVDGITALTGREAAQIRTLLIGALTHAAQWRKVRYDRSERPRDLYAGEKLEDLLRREHDTHHEGKLWDLWRLKHPTIPTWDQELELRRARHRKLRCEACPLLSEEAA